MSEVGVRRLRCDAMQCSATVEVGLEAPRPAAWGYGSFDGRNTIDLCPACTKRVFTLLFPQPANPKPESVGPYR